MAGHRSRCPFLATSAEGCCQPGPSHHGPGKAPSHHLAQAGAASTLACILGFTVSTAAGQAALGVSCPGPGPRRWRYGEYRTSVRGGAMFRPPSVLRWRPVRPRICRTIRWLGGRCSGRVRSRACLSRVPVDTVPFAPRTVFAGADGLNGGVGLGRIPDVKSLHRSGVKLPAPAGATCAPSPKAGAAGPEGQGVRSRPAGCSCHRGRPRRCPCGGVGQRRLKRLVKLRICSMAGGSFLAMPMM